MARYDGTKHLLPAKKGEIRNPLGINSDPLTRAIKRLTAAEIAEIGTIVVSKNLSKLKDIVRDAMENEESKHSAMKVWIARVAIKGIIKGDAHALDVLLNRLVGKVKEKIELSGPDGGSIRAIVGAMSAEEREKELARLRQLNEEVGDD